MQVFVPYKEVLQLYEGLRVGDGTSGMKGLQVPDYVTLMWCDDNYGYITRLSNAEKQQIVNLLQEINDLQLNILSVKTGITIGQLTALLFQLEMKGIVKPLAGGMYHLLL